MTTDYQGWPADVVERRARAMCTGQGIDPDEIVASSGSAAWTYKIHAAIATLEADEAAGYVLVPRLATEKMVAAACQGYEPLYRYRVIDINAAIAAGAVRKEG